MKITELTNKELKKAFEATEKMLGPDSYEIRVLKQEIQRRKRMRKSEVKNKQHD